MANGEKSASQRPDSRAAGPNRSRAQPKSDRAQFRHAWRSRRADRPLGRCLIYIAGPRALARVARSANQMAARMRRRDGRPLAGPATVPAGRSAPVICISGVRGRASANQRAKRAAGAHLSWPAHLAARALLALVRRAGGRAARRMRLFLSFDGRRASGTGTFARPPPPETKTDSRPARQRRESIELDAHLAGPRAPNWPPPPPIKWRIQAADAHFQRRVGLICQLGGRERGRELGRQSV